MRVREQRRMLQMDDQQQFDPEFLNKINCSGLPPYRLVLKEWDVIILIKPLDVR